MGSYRIDESRPAIVVVTFEGTLTSLQFRQYLAELDEVVDRHQRHVIVYDATQVGRVSTAQRKMQADWIRDRGDVLREKSAGVAFVISSPMVRLVLTSILWMQRIDWDYTVLPHLEDGLEWARRQLGEPNGDKRSA